jgi:hypothetical protein
MIADVTADAPAILYDDDMANFGLVNAAGPQNTATFDINNDGDEELLIADENFIRAASFDTASGWTVTDQITVPDPAARLAAITTLDTPRGTAIVAADTTNDLILVIEQREDRVWAVRDKLRLTGIDVNALHAGAFDGRDSSAILAVSPDAFAIIKLAGQRVSLDEFASFRSDDEQRREHEIEAGDINADGFTDLVVVDDNDKTLRIFTLSRSRKLLDATAFKVFEQRLFSQQSRGGREPSAIAIDDVTAGGLDDIIVEVHDRYIIYPQQAPNPSR